jgi:hypothetical protein
VVVLLILDLSYTVFIIFIFFLFLPGGRKKECSKENLLISMYFALLKFLCFFYFSFFLFFVFAEL